MGASPRRTKSGLEIPGAVWIAAGSENMGGKERIALLRAIVEEGSITRAAQAAGFSYKGAWIAIDAMNRLAGAPLVERMTGGRGGGFTRLTPHGERLVA